MPYAVLILPLYMGNVSTAHLPYFPLHYSETRVCTTLYFLALFKEEPVLLLVIF